MAFTNTHNNVQSVPVISAFTDITPSIGLASGYGQLFPLSNCAVTVELRDSSSVVVKREVVKYATRTGDNLNGLTRAFETCVQDDTAIPRVRSQTTLDFTPGPGETVTVSVRYTESNDKEIKDRIIDLETNKANDNAVVHKTGDETIDDVKTFTDSPIVPTPTTNMQASTKKYVDDTILEFLAPEALYEFNDYLAGEDILEKEVLRLGINTALAYSGVGNTSSNTIVSTGGPKYQTISWQWSEYNISSVMHKMGTNSGTHVVSCEIRADDGVTVLDTADATVTVNAPGGGADYTFNFSSPPTLLPGVTYRIYWIGGNSNLNHMAGINVYPDGQSDIGAGNDYYFSMSGNRVRSEDTTRLYKASSYFSETLPKDYMRISYGDYLEGEIVKCKYYGLADYTGLTANTIYYLSNIAGEISDVRGNFVYHIGESNESGLLYIGSIKNQSKVNFIHTLTSSTNNEVLNIPHTLGKVPTKMYFTGMPTNNDITQKGIYEYGQSICLFGGSSVSGGNTVSGAIGILDYDSSSNRLILYITDVTDTNIQITTNRVNSGSGSETFLIELM